MKLDFKDYIKSTKSIFFRYKNDIDIYVEDNNDEEFYKVLLNRVLETTNLKVDKLISLGNRKNVIDTCLTDQTDRKRKRLYIIDGDLNLILGDIPEINYLYVHKCYCIENYLIDEKAILEILHDNCANQAIDKIQKTLTFNNWLKGISTPLIDLFLHFALAHKFKLRMPTVKGGISNYQCQKNGLVIVDNDKINTKISEIKEELLKQISEEEYNDLIYNLRQKYSYNVDNLLIMVSGKHFLLPLVQERIKKVDRTNISRETIRLRLAKLCNIDKFNELKETIKKT